MFAMRGSFLCLLAALAASAGCLGQASDVALPTGPSVSATPAQPDLPPGPSGEPSGPPLTLVVMDPLAAPLSCPCVAGYAQRKYEQLAEHLQAKLQRPFELFFNESLATALKESAGAADIVIGKHSVVVADGKAAGISLTPRLALTGKDGSSTMTGLIVVATTDPALLAGDLKDYRIFFGPAECDEKHAAALKLLLDSGVTPPEQPETCQACSEGATKILELGPTARAATVISSYAQPLLEGCGTIKKGDLRVVGVTEEVPFIEAFVNGSLSADEQAAIEAALLAIAQEPQLLVALETKAGFQPLAAEKKTP